jgi:hypothetical protein
MDGEEQRVLIAGMQSTIRAQEAEIDRLREVLWRRFDARMDQVTAVRQRCGAREEHEPHICDGFAVGDWRES